MRKFKLALILLILSFSVLAADSDIFKLDIKTKQALTRDLKNTINPKGEIMLGTNGGYKNVVLSRINSEGKLETYCTDNEKDANRFFAGDDISTFEAQK